MSCGTKLKTDLLRHVVRTMVLSKAYFGLSAFAPYLNNKQIIEIQKRLRLLSLSLTGCLRTTRSTVLSVEADIPPFEFTINHQLAIAHSRYIRRCPDDPTQSLINATSDSKWLEKASYCSKKFPTGKVRSQIVLPHQAVPWEDPPPLLVDPALDFRRTDDKSNLLWARNMIRNLPVPTATVYTDASYFRVGVSSRYCCGSAAVLFIDGNQFTLQQRYDPCLMIYNAEQHALVSALELIEEHVPAHSHTTVHVFSDSKSALLSLSKGPLRQSSYLNNEIFGRVSQLGFPVRFQYVPSHCGLEGNEMADKLAKEAALSTSLEITLTPMDFRMAQCSIRNQVRREWLNARNNSSHEAATNFGRVQRFHESLSRSEEIQIARLRTSHHHLVKMPRVGLNDCQFCEKRRDTDTSHLLTECGGEAL
eukprot:TRINITY_DN2318_c1_g1_i7.p1 TRINITY_DN2318_c1_g1~~TRINITY_DN2318_c1_g1_i7.p1  ORF type:complete len:420 (+),score=24.95 TRINITY_DN2318_c1_g1_i7:131-1390(+)